MTIDKLHIRTISRILLTLICSVALISCNSDDGTSENQRTSIKFNNLIDGKIDAVQSWKTAISLRINVTTDRASEIIAYSFGLENIILFDRKTISQNGIVTLTVPQGYGNRIMLLYSNGVRRLTSTITLTGAPQQVIDINFPTTEVNAQAASRAATSPSLYGYDITPNIGYTDVDITKILDLLENVQEGINAESKNLEVNYELISNGPFNVSFLYGYTGCYDSRVLGYYYHSPGTYADMTFVDLTETVMYDYIDGKAKLQYQLDNDTDVWYDANFDYRDGFAPPYTRLVDRLGDDAYNIDLVIGEYGERITAIRGLSYLIDVPEGYRIGFYLKRAEEYNIEQRSSIIGKGIPANVLPLDFVETNFTANALNVDGKLRSFYYQNDGVTFMGFEDAGSNGDFDCNDIIIGVGADLEKELPTVSYPDVDAIIQSYDNMTWTIAFEDIGRNADFDFNDAVIRITPDYDKQTVDVYVCAAGSEEAIYLYYDGPDGDVLLCEIHEALGGGTYINTTSSIVIVPPKYIGTVSWPIEYTINQDAARFYCQIKRGSCEECTDIISLNSNPGEMPQAILVAGNWNWPKEGIDISTVYSIFPDWSKDVTKMAFWNWYSYPKSETYVTQ